MKNLKITKTVIIIASIWGTVGTAASFDCTKASSQIEKMICADVELSSIDSKLGKVYKEVLNNSEDKQSIKTEQRNWMEIRNKCDSSDCILQAYENQITNLNGLTNGKKSGESNSLEKKSEADKITKVEKVTKIDSEAEQLALIKAKAEEERRNQPIAVTDFMIDYEQYVGKKIRVKGFLFAGGDALNILYTKPGAMSGVFLDFTKLDRSAHKRALENCARGCTDTIVEGIATEVMLNKGIEVTAIK